MAKTWKIPVYWEMKGFVFKEADTLEEAMEMALYDEDPIPDGEYLDGSWDTDEDIEFVREAYNYGQEDDITEE